MNSRKSIISNFTSNRFVGLPGKLDDKLNQIVACENPTISSLLSVVDIASYIDNPNLSSLKKVNEPTAKLSLLQWMPSVSK